MDDITMEALHEVEHMNHVGGGAEYDDFAHNAELIMEVERSLDVIDDERWGYASDWSEEMA